MAGALVMIFLLNHLPDFKWMLNESVLSNQIDGFVQKCNPADTDPIIHAISRKIQLKIMSAESNRDAAAKQNLNKTRGTTYISETINGLETDVKSENDVDKSVYDIDMSECDIKMENAKDDNRKENQTIFPKSAPFLVAIFESLSNVTAQTCGGTLLSPHWVLTAANCVNLLHNFYANGSNVIETSRYTVVVNSTNPLTDGTVYNVTQVHLHPYPVPDIVKQLAYELKSQRLGLSSGPNLAILRIEPAVEGITVVVGHRHIGKDEDVMVYGWVMIKNDTGVDSVRAASFPATVSSLPSASEDESSPVLRLSVKNNTFNYNEALKMSSGGPVVVSRAGRVELVAVVHTDEGTALAYPLYEHLSWIEKVLKNK